MIYYVDFPIRRKKVNKKRDVREVKLDPLKVDIFTFLRKLYQDNLLAPNPYSNNQPFEADTLDVFMQFYKRLLNDVGHVVEAQEGALREEKQLEREAEAKRQGEERIAQAVEAQAKGQVE